MITAALRCVGLCPKISEQTQRRKDQLTRQCTYDMVRSAAPVFLAASVSFFVVKVIEYIVEESDGDHEALNVGLSFMVAIVTYGLGKYSTWRMAVSYSEAELAASEDRPARIPDAIAWMRKEKIDGPVVKLIAELSAFMMKDFLVELVLSLIYGEHGFGPAFGLWLLFVAIYVTWIRISAFVAQKLQLPLPEQAQLLEFDVESFALSVAYSFSAILSLGSAGSGFTYLSPQSYLYSYEDDYDEDENFGGNQYCLLYIWVCVFVTGLVLLAEEQIGIQYRPQTQPGEHAKDKQHMAEEEEKMVANSSIEFRHKVYGCFCGLAWFLFIVDNIAHLVGPSTLENLIGILLTAMLVSWRGPSFLAAMIMRMEHQAFVLRRRAAENETEEQPGCWERALEWSGRLGLHRRTVSVVAFRLALGWMWEVVVMQVFALISGTAARKGEEAGMALASLVVAVVVSYLVLWATRSWGTPLVAPPAAEPAPTPAENVESEAPEEQIVANPLNTEQY